MSFALVDRGSVFVAWSWQSKKGRKCVLKHALKGFQYVIKYYLSANSQSEIGHPSSVLIEF